MFLAGVLTFMALVVWTEGHLDTSAPSCAISCWENTKYVSKCLGDDTCLCNEREYQKSVFQCLYSQCDTAHFGSALHHILSQCSTIGDQTIIAVPPIPNHESLRRREAEYLARGELAGSGSAVGFPTQSTGFLTQSVGGSYGPATTTSTEIPLFTLDASTLLPDALAAASASPTAVGVESSPSDDEPVLFTGVAPEIGCSIGLPVMVTMAALYMAL